MIRALEARDRSAIHEVINAGAEAYRGVIPDDCWHEPYMTESELREEIDAGVRFFGANVGDTLAGVMGIQAVREVTLIRHAYVAPAHQRRGLGRALLSHLRGLSERPFLIGTWAAADWAIRFYEGEGFRVVSPEEKERLLRRYWTVPERQIETSVVLADARWREDPSFSASLPGPARRTG